jgi:hypothetical protein
MTGEVMTSERLASASIDLIDLTGQRVTRELAVEQLAGRVQSWVESDIAAGTPSSPQRYLTPGVKLHDDAVKIIAERMQASREIPDSEQA